MIRRIILTAAFVCVFINVIHNWGSWSFYSAGQIEEGKQNYAKASRCYKNALLLDSKDKDYRYAYVNSLTKLKPDINVQKEMFKIADDGQNDSAQQLASMTVDKWRFALLKNFGDNYIEQAIFHDGIIRWSIDKFPIKVFINNQSDKNLPDYYTKQIKNALSQWQTSTEIIKFALVNNLKDADIIINISQLPSDICKENNCQYTVGFTLPEYKDKTLKNMTITLYATNPKGNYFTDKELYNTVLHELGHALGIMGHSYNQNDLMFMSNENSARFSEYKSSFQYLSSKDINTIKLLYKLEPDITNSDKSGEKGLIYPPVVFGSQNDIKQRKLKEAQNYVQKAPDISNGYIDLGIAYLETNDNLNAEKSFQKAYQLAKSSTERYIASYNLAIVYFDSKKYEKAKEIAETAKKESDTDEINNLLMEINSKIK